MEKMKLSDKQKEVIRLMREKIEVLRWIGMPICKFRFQGKTLRYATGCALQDNNLIEVSRRNSDCTFYQLTELGKTIDL